MHVNFGPRGILQIDDAKLIFKNFEGRGDKFNREGDRNFSILIDDPDTADALIKEGWNVKIKPGRDEDEGPFMRLPVKIKFTDFGPRVYLKSGKPEPIELDEESIGCLDQIDIESVDLDIRPFDWEVNGRTGRSAYLQSIHVVQRIDRFAARYANLSEDEKLPF
jgi:hypothetical protein